MRIGFTGTRTGSTEASKAEFARWIGGYKPTEFRHGACKGWDAEAVTLVHELFPTCRIIAYPGFGWKDKGSDRPDRDPLAIEFSDEVLPERFHFSRNRAIVDDSDLLIGLPPTFEPQKNGGTWYTIHYAIKRGVRTRIIDPMGSSRVMGEAIR